MRKISMALATLALVLGGCGGGGGGGGGGSSSGYIVTHADLADDFVYRLNAELGFDVELVKTYTEQSGYIVVYDWDLGTYDAYDLFYYDLGDNALDYLLTYDYSFYYDLDYIGGNLYEDPYTGIIFEKSKPTSKDLMKIKALEEGVQVKKSADYIAGEFGLSEQRSQEVAKLAVMWANTPKDSMTDADHDAFAKEILGASITDYKKAYQNHIEGNKEPLEDLIEKSAQQNGISPEHANKLLDGMFGAAWR